MLPAAQNFFRPGTDDRLASVSVRPLPDQPGRYIVTVARGRHADSMAESSFGPYAEEQLPDAFAQAVNLVRGQGYYPPGTHALLTALRGTVVKYKSFAALRAGWRRDTDLVPTLVECLATAVDEACPILDALGWIGDARAVEAVRPFAARKLLSRRRSGVEALRNLGDEEGLNTALAQTFEQLPPSMRGLLQAYDVNAPTDSAVKDVRDDLLTLPAAQNQRGIILDQLYELGAPLPVAAVRAALPEMHFPMPYVWRYVKSVFKRSLLRGDRQTFGLLAHLIEIRGRTTTGTQQSVKSGYDGVQRSILIFGRETQDYTRRLSWRYLRRLAKYRPDSYAHFAAEAVVAYTDEDRAEPSGLAGELSRCYLFNRVVFGNSQRLRLDARRLVHSYTSVKAAGTNPPTREESYPELWDAQPRAFLRVLSAAKLREAHEFAVKAVRQAHPTLLEQATLDELLPLLDAPYEPTVQLGLEELERRFDPSDPDWDVVERVAGDNRDKVREIGRRWLELTASLWLADPNRTLRLLLLPNALTRSFVADLAVQLLPPDESVRNALAQAALAVLREPEPAEGQFEALGRVAREVLLPAIARLLEVDELLQWVASGSPAAQAVAGAVLALRPDALRVLGLERVTTLARHELAGVRQGAHALLRAAGDILNEEPDVLFVLVESEWDDTRAVALELLRRLDWGRLGLHGLGGLLDSNRVEVQNLGVELVSQYFPSLPTAELLDRLAQHPHPNVRRFAIKLAVEHAPPGHRWLVRLDRLFRSALFDVWPSRADKRAVLRFVARRALEDEESATAAAALLGDVARFHAKGDFSEALEALARVRVAYPDVENLVAVRPESVR